jgi:hypothetical protein
VWQRSGDSSFSTFSGGRDGAFEVERAGPDKSQGALAGFSCQASPQSRLLHQTFLPTIATATERHFNSHHHQNQNHTRTAGIMAEGIDRNVDEKMEFSTSKEVSVAPTFEAMHLKENLLRGIYAYGYESPSAVQSRAIVQVCKGRDTIAQAQSGTGKTATFSISILQVIDTAVRETQGT